MAELEEIAEQWRERRSRYFDNQPSEFIVVELLPRRPSTWWWRRWRPTDEPLPLLARRHRVGQATWGRWDEFGRPAFLSWAKRVPARVAQMLSRRP